MKRLIGRDGLTMLALLLTSIGVAAAVLLNTAAGLHAASAAVVGLGLVVMGLGAAYSFNIVVQSSDAAEKSREVRSMVKVSREARIEREFDYGVAIPVSDEIARVLEEDSYHFQFNIRIENRDGERHAYLPGSSRAYRAVGSALNARGIDPELADRLLAAAEALDRYERTLDAAEAGVPIWQIAIGRRRP